MRTHVSVQQADFDVAALQAELQTDSAAVGAIATFTGYVRGGQGDSVISALELEHYPGMTETSIEHILRDSAQRWPLRAATVVHRIDILEPGAQIVWVGVSAGHRGDAFAACEFIMDYLKTRAPFWKKESGAGGSRWVDARDSDNARAARWQEQGE